MDRVILHCDCNSFFASVESVRDPSLREVPMAVCGNPKNRHGIILAKNDLAKAAGVQTAETIWKARQKCPDLRLVQPHYPEYAAFSRQVNAIYTRYTDMVEPFGIDESWLDVTGSQKLFGSGREIADRLRDEVKAETGLTISVGVSFNKVFAKLGSDYQKPDATTEITRENLARVVYPLPVETMLYVGKSAQKALQKMAVRTIGDLAAADPGVLCATFGKSGEMLSLYARGEDRDPVRRIDDAYEAKSVGHGMTFCHDLTENAEIYTAIRMLSDSVATRLRQNGQFCNTVQLTIRTPDLHSSNRQFTLSAPSNLSREIADAAITLLHRFHREGAPIRMITVTATGLVGEEDGEQTSFFDEGIPETHQKLQRLENAMDGIRQKYGEASIKMGSLLQNTFISEAEKPEKEISAKKSKKCMC